MSKIKKLLREYWTYLAGGITGAIGGYLYWYYIGCTSGTCPITSSPIMSVIWGAVMGTLIFNMFKKEPDNEKK